MANTISPAGWAVGAGSLVQMWGLFSAGRSNRIEGEQRKWAADFSATQLERQANMAIAISQREAMEETRRAQLMESRNLAVAAASGGGVSDPTVVNLIADIAGEGSYRAAVAVFEGRDRARALRLKAASERLSGSYDKVSGLAAEEGLKLRAGAAGLLHLGAASLYAKYGSMSGDSALLDAEAGGT